MLTPPEERATERKPPLEHRFIGSWMNWLGFTYTDPITLTDPSALTAPRKFYRAVWAP